MEVLGTNRLHGEFFKLQVMSSTEDSMEGNFDTIVKQNSKNYCAIRELELDKKKFGKAVFLFWNSS